MMRTPKFGWLMLFCVMAGGWLLPKGLLAVRKGQDDPGLFLNDVILLQDDFENGIGKGWLTVSKGVRVVPENPDKPEGNHVARLSSGARLLGPPVKAGTLIKKDRRKALKRWSDYEFSFRFRVLGLRDDPGWKRNRVIIMILGWRVNPRDIKNRWERHLAYLQVNRGNHKWMLRGPLIPWYDKGQVPLEKEILREPSKPIQGIEKVSKEWIKFRVRLKEDRVLILWNAVPAYVGSDIRCPYGGVGISARYPKYLGNMVLELDDVMVKRIPPREGLVPHDIENRGRLIKKLQKGE